MLSAFQTRSDDKITKMITAIKEILSDIGSCVLVMAFLALSMFVPVWLWLTALIALALLLIRIENGKEAIRPNTESKVRRASSSRHTGTFMDW